MERKEEWYKVSVFLDKHQENLQETREIRDSENVYESLMWEERVEKDDRDRDDGRSRPIEVEYIIQRKSSGWTRL